MERKARIVRITILAGVLILGGSCPGLAKMTAVPPSFRQKVVQLAQVNRRQMAAVDNARLLAETLRREAGKMGTPFTFAHALEVDFDLTNSGTWETLADGSRLWRLIISSPHALHINLGFQRFDVPEGAELWIYDPAGDALEGPYTVRQRSARGRLFTPVIPGDEIVIELHVPAAAHGLLDIQLGVINHGFRGFEKNQKSHGTCNNDVVCPEGNPWRDQIRSVARYSISGTTLCNGQLVNNTAEDETPYFLSAFHCGVDAANAGTVVVYWNYESPTCGQQGGGSLADNQTGAIFRASEQISDFLLFELAQPPDLSSRVYYTGWDVSGATPQGSVGIHHPSGDVKSISFNDDVLTMDVFLEPNILSHWRVDNWEDGTTEGGSSGSCLWDPDTSLCIGVLTGGLASCSVIDLDIYGKLSLAWNSGTTPQTRLRDWLDPLNTGMTSLNGHDSATDPALIFSDGFESGDTSMWSSTLP